MSEEMQIEEMIIAVKKAVADYAAIDYEEDSILLDGNDLDHLATQTAEELYNEGYRKASEVAKEIFEAIDKLLDKHFREVHFINGTSTFFLRETLKFILPNSKRNIRRKGNDKRSLFLRRLQVVR